jgi:hypothetical protein
VSILDLNFQDVYEPELIPDGTEVSLTIRSAELVKTKSQANDMLNVVLYDASNPKTAPFTERLVIPSETDKAADLAKWNNKMRRIQNFMACFNLQSNGVDPSEAFPGATGTVIVREEEDATYGKQNSIRKFVVGH